MNKALEAADAINAAWESTRAIARPISIYLTDESKRVHLADARDLEQIPGEAVRAGRAGNVFYPWRVSKTVAGVEFYCYSRESEG
jgi:hypothetical protein